MYDESLGNNEDIRNYYEYWNIPRKIVESSASKEVYISVLSGLERADK